MQQKPSTKTPINIILTGGHAATTALATIEELTQRGNLAGHKASIYWIGSKYAFEGKKSLTLEAKIFPKMGVGFYSIITGRLQRRFTRWTVLSLIKIPVGFFHALFLIARIRPKVILSFGGFSSFPVVVVGRLLGISTVIHEQTSVAGRANRLAVSFTSKIAISHTQSQRFFPKKKTVLTGNPIMKSIVNVKARKKLFSSPVLYITGGSRGSQSINKAVDEILNKLLMSYLVVHQCGDNDWEYFNKRKKLAICKT